MKLDTYSKFSPTTLALHWIVALTVIGLLAVGVYMEETETYALYPWHKSFGLSIFFVVLLRVAWRIKNGWPTPVGTHQRYEQRLAKVVHYTLIIGTVLMPLSGFVMSAAGGSGVDWFGLEVIARNIDPNDPRKALAHSKMLAGFAREVHGAVGFTLICAITLHITGALKHHIKDKDGTLRRMFGAEV